MDYHEKKEAKIIIEHTDVLGTRGSNEFKTVKELADFLKQHNKVAEKGGYVSKK